MTYRIRIVTSLTLALLLTGCADHTDTSAVSETHDSEQVEQSVYQKAAVPIVEDQTAADQHPTDSEPASPKGLVYRIFIYEIRDDDVESYAVITGVTDAFRDTWGAELRIPEKLGTYPVKEIGPNAFANRKLWSVEIPATVERIGEGAFQGNENLYKVLFTDTDCEIEEGAFAGCREPLYFCYEETSEEKDNLVINYAEENGFLPVENIVFGEMDKEPVVRYPSEPLHLTPRVEDFFYGEYADDDNFCSFEYAEDATDFGWSEWHAPCGEFEVGEGEIHLTASSTLASSDDRYAVDHLLRLTRDDFMDEGVAWAEGVEGTGVGEYIIYNTRESWIGNIDRYQDRWSMLWPGGAKDEKGYPADSYGYPYDGYMRYLEVCVVNGYAIDEKTWDENGRVRTLLRYVEDKPYAYLELEDTYKPQYFELPEEDIMAVDGGEISFRFEIVDVYSGSKYEDTCLTGLVLEFSGRFGH